MASTPPHQGLEQYGVGQWREISDSLLPQWDETALRIKAARLLGSQSLARYVGWKGDRYEGHVGVRERVWERGKSGRGCGRGE